MGGRRDGRHGTWAQGGLIWERRALAKENVRNTISDTRLPRKAGKLEAAVQFKGSETKGAAAD